MVSPFEIQLLNDFGFYDYNHLKKSLNTPLWKKKPDFNFKWRILMMSKYKNYKSEIINDIIKYHTHYENFIIKSQRGYSSTWPEKTKQQFIYLFVQLQKPWVITKHGSNIFSIKDPFNNLWFRAIDSFELFHALDICYKESKIKGQRTKPVMFGLNWEDYLLEYRIKRKNCNLWEGINYDIALLICDNITSTWNTKTGDWEPWNNIWSQNAYIELFSKNKSINKTPAGNTALQIINEFPQFRSIEKQTSLKYFNITNKKLHFSDISDFVSTIRFSDIKQNNFTIFNAFLTYGYRAAKSTNDFYEQNNLTKWWI